MATAERLCVIGDGGPGRALAALSGPSIAPELALRLPATVVVAAPLLGLVARDARP